jgi:ABC-2 type transport system ATP-binding protein
MRNQGKRDPTNAITIQHLVKRYGSVTAVDELDLDIRRGELFGFLGPNGAGKTTTINILCGLLQPTSGTVMVDGFDVARDRGRFKSQIGLCPQEAAVYKFLTGRENIELIGNLYQMDKEILQQRVDMLISQSNFSESARRQAKGYSGGMLRHLNLMMALINDPEILFLDEPTVGMDVRARRATWEYIALLKQQHKTIVLTTHYIEEAQALSDRVGIIDYGQLIGLGTPTELMDKYDAPDLESVFLTITGRRIAEGS